METYYLTDILEFFSREQKGGYQNINKILTICRNKRLSEFRKWALLVSALRYLGLNEVEIPEGPEIVTEYKPEDKVQSHMRSVNFPMELFPVEMMNGPIIFEVIIN